MCAVAKNFNTEGRTAGLLAVAMIIVGGLPALAGESHRQLGAHEHGRGNVGLVVEGAALAIELEAPGADIVGFEHKARKRAEKQAVAAAKALLSSPEKVFDLPAGAGCKADKVEVKITHESHKADDHGHAKGKAHKHGHDHGHDHDGDQHSAFTVQYAFTCRDTGQLTSIGFPYFKAFPGARSLEVTVVAPKGQSQFEATRDRPQVDLANLR